MIVINTVGEKQVVVMPGESEREIMKEMSLLALENNSWNITAAGRAIGVSRTTLTMRIRAWKLRLMRDQLKQSPQ